MWDDRTMKKKMLERHQTRVASEKSASRVSQVTCCGRSVITTKFYLIVSTVLPDKEDEFRHGTLSELQLSTWKPAITARMPHVQ